MITSGTWRGVLALILVGAGLGLGYNALSPKPLPWIAQSKKGVSLEALTQAQNAEAAPNRVDEDPVLTTAAPPETASVKTASVKTADPAPAAKTPPPAAKVPAPAESTDTYPEIPASEFPIEIHLEQAVKLYGRGGLLILDARDLDEYAEGHIKGAVSAPYNTLAGDPDGFDKIAKDPRPVFCYCGGGHCELSMDLAFEIIRAGHQRVLVFMDGFPAWQDAGHPVSTGETP